MGAQMDLDAVVGGLDAFNRRDVDGLLQYFTPDVELLPFAAKLTGRSYVGEEGLREFLADLADEWAHWSVELDDIRSVSDQLLGAGRIVARGRETGVEVTSPAAFLYTMRGGRIARLESFDDVAEAEAASAAGRT